MNKENVIKFTKVKSFMMFDVSGEGFDESYEVEVSCGEDIESYLKMYLESKWDELFETYNLNKWDVYHATFKGFYMSGTDDNGNKFYSGNNHAPQYASVNFNPEFLSDKNATKIEEIRKIISR